jgi:hypothetical protein
MKRLWNRRAAMSLLRPTIEGELSPNATTTSAPPAGEIDARHALQISPSNPQRKRPRQRIDDPLDPPVALRRHADLGIGREEYPHDHVPSILRIFCAGHRSPAAHGKATML